MEVLKIREKESEGFGGGMLSIQIGSVLESARPPKLKTFESGLKLLNQEIEESKTRTIKRGGKISRKLLAKFPNVRFRSDRSDMVLNYKPPSGTILAGSYLLGTLLWSAETPSVDVCVIIPKECTERTDYKNHRYFDRRLLYLFVLFSYLSKSARWTNVELGREFLGGDRLKPLLTLQLSRSTLQAIGASEGDLKDCSRLKIRIIPSIENDALREVSKRASLPCTELADEMYWNSLASEMQIVAMLQLMNEVKTKAAGFSDALLLLKRWRERRNLSISPFMLTACLARLILDRVVPPMASVQHMFLACLQYLSTWRISSGKSSLRLAQTCDVLLMLSQAEQLEVSMDATAALKAIESPSTNSDLLGGAYACLFATSPTFNLAERFDVMVTVKTANSVNLNYLSHACSEIIGKALGKACDLASPRILSDFVGIGLLLNPEHQFGRVLTAEDSDMDRDSFRAFWGSRSGLRRFKDGRIVESVVWSRGGMEGIREACAVAIGSHVDGLDSESVGFIYYDLSAVLPQTNRASVTARRAAERLGNALRNMDGIPLDVAEVAFAGEILLGTSVLGGGPRETRCRPASNLILSFETSPEWPKNLEGIQASMAAFYVAISKSLRKGGFDAMSTKTHVEVEVDSFFFRARLRYDAIVAFLPEEAREAQIWITVRQPRLHNALRSVCGEDESAAFQETCRLAKHWLSSHWMGNHFCDELVELLVARFFFYPDSQPHGRTPGSASTAFAAFLSLLANFPWEVAPLVIVFDDDDTIHEKAEKAFRSLPSRSSAPPMIVSTAGDLLGKSFSPAFKRGPERVVLKRMVAVASAALRSFVNGFDSAGDERLNPKILFRESSKSKFDAQIRLREECVPSLSAGIDWKNRQRRVLRNGPLGSRVPSPNLLNVLVGANPTDELVRRLESLFGHIAVFFHNKNGGTQVGVVWRPRSIRPRKLTLYGLPFSRPVFPEEGRESDKATEIVFDKRYAIYAMRKLGGDLVTEIDMRT
eukprot:CAMPEP_0184737530 /NCGR_PEP_ID=MMETSP0315-20130426/342_1 /TAXON_ID=101924 /ORGANISM="Rhodosorus marinus, Strain UTEX LB 2760" /LENGTH=993 /DNA_ID=CAMNT_0027204791 /DNA_START=235 /DNA_END=3216 /DNA_ORIENTATION=-